jgi:non-ribosomal peptide synthetase component E (peptide arylation enzyme)
MARTWCDPRAPAPEDSVLRPLLEQRAAETADGVFARFADGTTWTYRQTRDVARRAALGFQSLGVQHGDTVLSWLPNGPDALRVWFGLNYLGLSGTRALNGRRESESAGQSRQIYSTLALLEPTHPSNGGCGRADDR